jgi:hypothetical protein
MSSKHVEELKAAILDSSCTCDHIRVSCGIKMSFNFLEIKLPILVAVQSSKSLSNDILSILG